MVGWFWLGGLALAWCLVVRDSVWSKPLLAGYYSDPQVDYYTNNFILLMGSIVIILSEEDKNDWFSFRRTQPLIQLVLRSRAYVYR